MPNSIPAPVAQPLSRNAIRSERAGAIRLERAVVDRDVVDPAGPSGCEEFWLFCSNRESGHSAL
jgi:hypothetical protein